MNLKPMLNAYPDSLGGTLGDIVTLLKQDDMKGVFGSFYILPSLYHSDLDRGFSVIDYDINEELAERDDLEALKEVGIDLKLDFILNSLHSSKIWLKKEMRRNIRTFLLTGMHSGKDMAL